MSNQPKKKIEEESKEERVHPFDSFWKFHKNREDHKENNKPQSDNEGKRPIWW